MRWTDVLDEYFRHRAAQDLFSGAVLITQGATRLYARAYGYASRAWRVPNTLDTRFDTASITKLFTAIATLQLIDRGLLAFDTPVVERLGLEGTTALEGNQRLSPADPYLGHRRRRRRRGGRTLRRPVEGKAQLLRHRNPRLPAPIREQAGQLPPRRRVPLLQLRLRPPGPPDRIDQRDDVPRLRPRPRLRRSGDDRLRFLPDGPRQPQRRRRMRSDSRRNRAPSWAGKRTSTPSRRSGRRMVVPTSRSPTWTDSCGQ